MDVDYNIRSAYMKKMIGVMLTAILVAISVFALTGCGGLLGIKIDKDTYDKAAESFSKMFAEGASMKIEAVSTGKTENTYDETYTDEYESSTEKYTKSSYKYSLNGSINITIIIDGDKAYYKKETSQNYKYSDGNTSSEKETEEYFVEKTGSDFYVIKKDNNGNWVAVEKTVNTVTDYSIAYYMSNALQPHAANGILYSYKFDDFEYSRGRYNLKQSVIEENRKYTESKNDVNNKYNYSYGNNKTYIIFNNDKLFGGYASETDYTETRVCVEKTTYTRTTKDHTKSINGTSQAKITYGATVNIPSYTK